MELEGGGIMFTGIRMFTVATGHVNVLIVIFDGLPSWILTFTQLKGHCCLF